MEKEEGKNGRKTESLIKRKGMHWYVAPSMFGWINSFSEYGRPVDEAQ